MPEQWLTYQQIAEQWGMSVDAARTRVRRSRLQRRTSNDGQTEVLVDLSAPVRRPRKPRSGGQTTSKLGGYQPPTESPSATLETALNAILEHVVTLKGEIAKAEALAEQFRQDRDGLRSERDAERERVADLTTQLLRITTDLADARKVESQPRGWWRRIVG